MYRYPPFGDMVIRLSDGAFVPKTDEDLLAWLAQGNKILPADPRPFSFTEAGVNRARRQLEKEARTNPVLAEVLKIQKEV